MPADVQDGWVIVPYEGDEMLPAYLSLAGTGAPAVWLPAFLDYAEDGSRVAKIRVPAGAPPFAAVWVRTGADGPGTPAGRVRIT